MPNIKVQYDTRSYTIEEGDGSGERYSWQGVTGANHSIMGVEQVDDDRYGDLSTSFDVEVGEQYYLLYVLYSTGCSFSRSEGEIEFVGLYKDPAIAKENADRIWKKARKDGERSFSVNLIAEDGQEYQLHTPWEGYFERLEDVRIELVTTGYRYSARGY